MAPKLHQRLYADLYPPLRLNAVDWLIYAILLGGTIVGGAFLLAVWTGLEVARRQRSPWAVLTALASTAGLVGVIWLSVSMLF
jgi:hypothetical protein